MVAITGIDVKSIAIAREEAILGEQGVPKRRAVSFTKHKAELVLTGYRAGSMGKSSSISSDETGRALMDSLIFRRIPRNIVHSLFVGDLGPSLQANRTSTVFTIKG